MFDTLLLRPSLHCNTPLHFTTLHPTPLHYTYQHFTSSHLHFTTLSFSFTHLHFLLFYFTSHHVTRHSTDLIPQIISKITNPFTTLRNFSPFFTSLFILFYLFTYPILLAPFGKCCERAQKGRIYYTDILKFFFERKGPGRHDFLFSECKETTTFPPRRKTTCKEQDKRIRIL